MDHIADFIHNEKLRIMKISQKHIYKLPEKITNESFTLGQLNVLSILFMCH